VSFDKIKIDASFVRELSKGKDGLGIVHAIVNMVNRLGLDTVAEGVETETQLEVIMAEGCTAAQGYLFSPPMPAGGVSELISLFDKPAKTIRETAA